MIAQIEALKEQPTLDYVLFIPNPAPAICAKFADPMGSSFFVTNRNRAMTNGDPQSVAMMFSQLQDSAMQVAEGFVLGHEGLKKQIFREYGVNVDAVLRHNKKSQASTVASAAVPSNGADSNAKVLRKRLFAKVDALQPADSRKFAPGLSVTITGS